MESFIEIYDHSLTTEECERCIDIFESSNHIPGSTYNENKGLIVKPEIKKDLEMPNTGFSDNSEFSQIIHKGLSSCIHQYYQKHYHNLFQVVAKWSLDDTYNAQKYLDETDGFKRWHCESGSIGTSRRMLAWMIYLNNAQSGTDFYYYPTVSAKQGRCVIWPAYWTHTHRSQENVGVKYLATGWVSYCED